ncbi:MAG: hypothetical protein F4X59_15950 [Holophagales bacterium]|nr:hypothetical protein [Holophagales bacterium]MYC11602.1 hypothetical protein [Holophagales bacterium]
MTSLTLREHVAEPANLWIRHSFSRWPAVGEDDFWCDLATGSLRSSGAAADAASVDAADAVDLLHSVTDVVYVPPIAAEHGPLRSSIIETAAAAGAPLLVQVVWGRLAGTAAADLPPNATMVLDLLDSLVCQAAALREEFRENRQSSLPFAPAPLQDATLVWPLISGWTDQPEVLDPATVRFAAAGVHRVVPRSLELVARDRRLLAERLQTTWPEAFDALFHGGESAPDAGAFRTAAKAAGLEHRLPRPLPAPPLPPRLRLARELAGHLIERGDAAVTGGDAYYRAARFLDQNEIDIEAAAREDNLGILPWLEDPARQAVEQWLSARRAD